MEGEKIKVWTYFACMISEGRWIIERQANEEHSQSPSDWGEHALSAVQIRVLLAEHVEHGRIGQRHARAAKELADDDQQ